ncbi:MAG: hypothetical protein ACYC48_01035 [Minisyncoccota bacterium]
MKTRLLFVITVILAAFAMPTFTLAATNAGSGTVSPVVNAGSGTVAGNTTLLNPLKAGTSLSSFLSDILAFVIQIGTIVIILMLVFVGYKFVVAQGKPGEIEAAKKMLLWTVIGALVLLGAQAISSAIQATVSALGG